MGCFWAREDSRLLRRRDGVLCRLGWVCMDAASLEILGEKDALGTDPKGHPSAL